MVLGVWVMIVFPIVFLIPIVAFAQDTTRLEPIATILASKVLYNDEARLVVTVSHWDEDVVIDSILIYDITEPYQPHLIDRAIPIVTRFNPIRDYVVADHSDAVLFDDLVVSPIIREARYGHVFPDVRFTCGPIELCGESLDGFGSWRILIQDVIEWGGEEDSVENPPSYRMPGGLERVDDLLYVAAGSWGLRIYDLSERLDPTLVDTLDYIVSHLDRDGDLMILGGREIIGLDVSDPAHPTECWRLETAYYKTLIFGGYLYSWNIVERSVEFTVWEASIDAEPRELNRIVLSRFGNGFRLVIEEGKLYTRLNNIVSLYSLLDPLSPELEKSFHLDRTMEGFAIAGRLMIMESESSPERYFSTAYLYDALENSVDNPNAPFPSSLILHPCFPNPFNSSTTITYDVAHPGFVRLGVYDALGRLVGTVKEGYAAQGSYQAVWNGEGVPSGNYMLRLEGAEVGSIPVTLLK